MGLMSDLYDPELLRTAGHHVVDRLARMRARDGVAHPYLDPLQAMQGFLGPMPQRPAPDAVAAADVLPLRKFAAISSSSQARRSGTSFNLAVCFPILASNAFACAMSFDASARRARSSSTRNARAPPWALAAATAAALSFDAASARSPSSRARCAAAS